MPGFRPFGYTGEPGTCLWCGKRLRRERVHATDADEGNPSYNPGSAYGAPTIQAAKAGPYQDDAFDTLGCGYRFGRRLAELGRRLAVPR